jgi:hypothetical protein
VTEGLSEADIQRAVFAFLKERGAPGVIAWHVPNGPEARRRVGYRAGVPDVTIVTPNETFFLELKRTRGKASADQLAVVAEINRGKPGRAYIADGLDDAIVWMELQGILR